MADGNATNVGSIVGKLKIDSSDWNRELAAAETKARQLGRANPTVKVTTTGGPKAVAELTAVEAAEKKVSASSAALSRMRAQGRAATIAQALTEKESVKPVMDFTAWTRRSTEATRDDTVAKDANSESNKRVDNTSRQAGRSIHMLYAGIAMLAPAVVPLAGFAVAGAGALGIMGVTGVLAIKGISDELKAGGPLANQYAEGIGAAKDQLATLGRSSAVGMLDGFNRSIATINAYMPGLTTQTDQYSRALGNLGANSLAGVLSSFRTLDPVFKAFTGYLGVLTGKLSTLGSSDGLQRFGDYALATMPLVESTLESLVTGVGNLLVALSPLGHVALTSLKVVGDILTAIPAEVLTLITGGALGAYAAFSTWSSLIPLIQSFGIMLNMSLGPIGLVVAGVGALAGVMIGAAASTKDNTAATLGYTAALERDNGIIAENVRAHTAQEIAKSKAGEAAQKLGVSLELMTKAATGDVVAQERLGNELERLDRISKDHTGTTLEMGGVNVDLIKSHGQMQSSIKTVRDELGNQSGALKSAIDYQKRFDEAMGSTNASAGAQGSQLSSLAGMFGVSVGSLQGAIDGEKAAAEQLEKTTVKMQLQNDAAGILKGSLDLLNGKALSAAQAQNAFDSSLANMGDHVDKTGKKITFTTTSITDMSAASVALRGQLNGQIANLQQVVEANGGLSNSTGKAKAEMEKMRTQIIDNAVAHGVDKDAVTAYVDKLLKIPKSVPPTKLDVDKATAEQKIRDVQWRLDQLQTYKRIFIDVQQSTSNVDNTGAVKGSSKVKMYAGGGMVSYLASGGFPDFRPRGTDTVPAMLTPGEIVMKKSSVDSIGAGRLLAANETGRLPDAGVTVQIVAPDRATAREFFDVAQFEMRQTQRGGAWK
ncbi:hypothetical protein [Arthrobacter sp. Soil763]|uniref:hypothetical protein n=1 Tax=Arthrobacter sp. Soil763 TaxID=1736402 RepID=UPI0006F8FF4C|nr:hypothetical protein [Arthrobacter sp. Soil763]KRE79944.1 hypothetical protein ASG71_07880 [Arthrobacter sp. Soil763]